MKNSNGSLKTNQKSRSRIEVNKHRIEQNDNQGGKSSKAMQNHIHGAVKLIKAQNLLK